MSAGSFPFHVPGIRKHSTLLLVLSDQLPICAYNLVLYNTVMVIEFPGTS